MFKFCLILLVLAAASTEIPTALNFADLAQLHCRNYPIDTIWRMATGRLAQIYGNKYKHYDAYIRQFVGYDNEDKPAYQPEEQMEQDWVVKEYTQGLNSKCSLQWEVKQVYAIWRFFRFVINHDYLYEWLRAKMRISFGYQIQKPSSWMDGEQKQERLRLDKLFSNQYLDSLEDLMYRDFLFPLLTTLRKSVTIAAAGTYTKSKNPLLINIIETRNYQPHIFFPVNMQILDQNIFAFTIPGLPLLLTGSTTRLSWAFTGILVDRTNIEWIETSGSKYFHEETQRWIKIQNITETIAVKDEQDYIYNYYWSEFGTLVQKSRDSQKVKQYIVRWHENEQKVRRLFSGIVSFVKQPLSKPILHFPFNSLIIINAEGIHHLLCPLEHPSYFLYPDLMGEPKKADESKLWASNPKRGFWVVSNTHLSSIKPEGYLDRELFNSNEQLISETIRKWKDNKVTASSALSEIEKLSYDSNTRKITDLLLVIYRRAKFTYLTDNEIRNQCDQLVAMLDKWDYTVDHPVYGSIYRLWIYYLKSFTFSHLTKAQSGKYIARYRLTTDTYFASQINLWKQVTSYGECHIHQYQQIQRYINHTNHNCTCYHIVFKAINQTRHFLKHSHGLTDTKLSNFANKVHIDMLGQIDWKFNDKDLAFDNTYNRNLVMAAELNRPPIYSIGGDKVQFEWPQQTNTEL